MIRNLLLLGEKDERFDKFNVFQYPSLLQKKVKNYEEVLKFIKDNQIDTLVCDAGHVHIASRLLWMSDYLKRYILTDTDDPLLPEDDNRRNAAKMWNIIAVQAGNEDNPIKQSGWVSSYTNENFTEEEMKEYVKNATDKLRPYLFKTANVLEIGVASGITCSEIAPLVGRYIGVDISEETLKRTKTALVKKNITNVDLIVAEAMEVTQLNLEKQDIIIINSVAQYFAGYNYFIVLIEKLVECVNDKGIIFLGDILDSSLKSHLEKELEEKKIRKRNIRDLYYPKKLMRELPAYIPEIVNMEITKKSGKIENELKKYRYDVMLHIERNNKQTNIKRTKFQYAMLSEDFSFEHILDNEGADTEAYKSILQK